MREVSDCFCHNLISEKVVREIKLLTYNGNRTEWSPIWSTIVAVINKICRQLSGSLIFQ